MTEYNSEPQTPDYPQIFRELGEENARLRLQVAEQEKQIEDLEAVVVVSRKLLTHFKLGHTDIPDKNEHFEKMYDIIDRDLRRSLAKLGGGA